MPTIACPQCAQRYTVDQKHFGSVFRCSRCGATVSVPPDGKIPASTPQQSVAKQAPAESAQLKELRAQTELLRLTLERTEKIHWWVRIIGIPTLIALIVVVFGFFAGFASAIISALPGGALR